MSGQKYRLQTLCTLTETREKTKLNACRCTRNENEILWVKTPFDLRVQNVVCTRPTKQSACLKETDKIDEQKNWRKTETRESCKMKFDLGNMDTLQFSFACYELHDGPEAFLIKSFKF